MRVIMQNGQAVHWRALCDTGTDAGKSKTARHTNVSVMRRFGWILGAGKRSRTPDLRITNALLYQLSYAGNDLEVSPRV
ncbi:MAG: hypothetical protein RI925_1745 [Pseudomonadota bacterium]